MGSTELFQGQERKVIILSTVRSSADQIGFDVRHHLGFLRNPKRFNVATTRACSLMVVVGNPRILATDPHWRCLLRECVRLGGYKGVPLPADLLTSDGRDDGAAGSGDEGAREGEAAQQAADDLAADLEELVLGASERVQQEGMEMPTWGS